MSDTTYYTRILIIAFKMHRAKNLVLTFLSPHPAQSRSAVQFLQHLFQVIPTPSSQLMSKRDHFDETYFGSSSSSWHSTGCTCNNSGTTLHFLSLSDGRKDGASTTLNSGFSLLSITESSITDNDELLNNRIQLSNAFEGNHFFGRKTFMSAFEARLRGAVFSTMQRMGKEVQTQWLLPSTPLLDLDTSSCKQEQSSSDQKVGLKELVVPFFSEFSTIQSNLAKSTLSRPLSGLYKHEQSGVVIRPLPAADEDLRLPPPSLIFNGSIQEKKVVVEQDLGGKTAKIGWRGNSHRGSLIVKHPSITGLDVRICEDWVLCRSFDEAEDAVLAGSLNDLQSSSVMSEGKNSNKDAAIDPKTNNADCWIEARSNMKRPAGFLKRNSRYHRIAKPPQLPYE